MLPQALGAPTRSRDATGTILIGGLLVLFSVLFPLIWLFSLAVSPIWLVLAPLAVFPPLITLGYDLRVLEAGLRGTEATPPFLGWGQLARDGARSIALGVVYLVPAVVALGAASAIVAGVETGRLGLSERVATAVVGVTTAGAGGFVLLYACVFLYVRPATLAVFASTGRLRAALSPQLVLRVALSREYAIGWAVAVIVLLIGWVIAAPLQLLVVGFFIAFYVRAVAYYAYGSGARAAAPALTESSLGAERLSVTESGRSEPADSATAAHVPDGAASGASEPSSDQGVALSWSPRLDPEAAATVQVGRGVSLSSDGRGGESRERGDDAGAGDPATADAGAADATTEDRPDDGVDHEEPADGRNGDAAGGDTERDGGEDSTTDHPFEWEREG